MLGCHGQLTVESPRFLVFLLKLQEVYPLPGNTPEGVDLPRLACKLDLALLKDVESTDEQCTSCGTESERSTFCGQNATQFNGKEAACCM